MKIRYLSSNLKVALVILLVLANSITMKMLEAQTAPVIGLHKNVPATHALLNANIVIKPGVIIKNANLILRDGYIEDVGVNVEQFQPMQLFTI